MIELKRTISSVIYQLYANALLKSVLLAFSAYLLAATLSPYTLLPLACGLVAFSAVLVLTNVFQDKKPQAIHLIHQRVADTEYSLHLLDKPSLNLAEQLQIDRLSHRVQQVPMPNLLFSSTGLYGLALLLSLGFHYGYPFLHRTSPPAGKLLESESAVTAQALKPTQPVFRSAQVRVQPPAYTLLPVKQTADLNVVAVSGSALQWQVQFSHTRQLSVKMANNRGEELPFRKSGEGFVYNDRLINSGLYAIKGYYQDSLIYQSDFFRLEALPDMAPKIEPESKELYRFHYLRDPKNITVSARISDDFRISQAFIVATVARGSGENVKFREVRFPVGANFKNTRFNKNIDLKGLNFSPGDELYYYWAAIDNRQPEGNFTKSDTYFIVYKDTANVDETELATMAVNIMPEYFRSQRQIIIDTEKLIAKRNKLAPKVFNSTSNEIGFDQKVLRLRYGQYLGEEFETSIGGQAVPAEGNGNGDPLEGFMHKHDAEGEEHDHKAEPQHDHAHTDQKAGGGKEDPLAALMEQYVHAHDDGEANTFYEQSTRSLLKMALEQMWQSELHLRLYEPEKALPYEKKALEYLKSAQQKARTFVKKTSFDPPPIKENEKRLTGELKNVTPRYDQQRLYDQARIRQLVGQVLGFLELPALNTAQRQTVQQLSAQITTQVMNSRLTNWSVLGSLQKLAGGKLLSVAEKQQLKRKLYELTGSAGQSGTPAYASDRKLEQLFWRKLSK